MPGEFRDTQIRNVTIRGAVPPLPGDSFQRIQLEIGGLVAAPLDIRASLTTGAVAAEIEKPGTHGRKAESSLEGAVSTERFSVAAPLVITDFTSIQKMASW
jgi:hypothetical protein